MRPANHPTVSGVALCIKKVGSPCFTGGVLNTSCAMDPFESLVKPTDSSEKCINLQKIEVVRFTEINKHF